MISEPLSNQALYLEKRNETSTSENKQIPSEVAEPKHGKSKEPGNSECDETGDRGVQTVSRDAEPSPQVVLPTWRLAVVTACLGLSLLLSALETSIVATALVSIASSLGDYDQANWVVVSYMLTYTGFLIIYARLSDIFGRKPALIAALSMFGAFSLACGFARNMQQLIILRAFQGMGGSGIYSMVFAIGPEIVPPRLFGVFSGVIGAVYASSSILGPILGGVIVNNGGWNWVFLLNVLIIVPVLIVLIIVFPDTRPQKAGKVGDMLRTVDWLGILLALAASILTIYALQSAGTLYPWSSAMVIATLTIGLASFLLFVGWEIYLPRLHSQADDRSAPRPIIPIFPVRLMKDRVIAACMLTAALTGPPFLTTLTLLPQRLQLTNALTPLAAGLRMLALLLSSALGSGLGGAFASSPFKTYLLFTLAAALIVVGVGLMTTLDTGEEVQGAMQAFMVILGLGFGMGLSSLIVVARARVGPADSAVLLAGLTQVRVLGGVVGVAVATALANGYLTAHLAGVLSEAEIASVLQDVNEGISGLDGEQQGVVRRVFGEAWGVQQRVMLVVSAVGFVTSLGAWTERGNDRGVLGPDGNLGEQNGSAEMEKKKAERGSAIGEAEK